MSNNDDRESADWYPGMELPSRKETHGRKKKSDRKERKEAYEQQREATPKVGLPEKPRAEESAEKQWQAYRDEVAVTAAIPMPAISDASEEKATFRESNGMPEDEQYLRDLIFGQHASAEHGEVEEVGLTVGALVAEKGGEATRVANQEVVSEATQDVISEAIAEATPDATLEEDGPVIARWKVALFFLFAPILLIAVLAYGKLAYVHQVPDFVRQHVPAYQSGEGFLILKPWWFGPPVFDLKSYPMGAGEEYSQWQLQLSDYADVVQNPTVLYAFPQDILQKK